MLYNTMRTMIIFIAAITCLFPAETLAHYQALNDFPDKAKYGFINRMPTCILRGAANAVPVHAHALRTVKIGWNSLEVLPEAPP
jgi:hypothetical protein